MTNLTALLETLTEGRTSDDRPCMQASGLKRSTAREIMNEADRRGLVSWAGYESIGSDAMTVTVLV